MHTDAHSLRTQRIRSYFKSLTVVESKCLGTGVESLLSYLIIDNATASDAGMYTVNVTTQEIKVFNDIADVNVTVGMFNTCTCIYMVHSVVLLCIHNVFERCLNLRFVTLRHTCTVRNYAFTSVCLRSVCLSFCLSVYLSVYLSMTRHNCSTPILTAHNGHTCYSRAIRTKIYLYTSAHKNYLAPIVYM